MGRHFISIWFFIGVLLGVYGILITGAGLWDLFYPTRREIVLGNLHPAIWWGGLLVVLGGVYVYQFFPGGDKKN